MTTTEAPQALPGDGLREGIVDELRRRLGDQLLVTELKPNDDLWVRVATASWRATGDALYEMGFEYFCFLSAIDWLSESITTWRCAIFHSPPRHANRSM